MMFAVQTVNWKASDSLIVLILTIYTFSLLSAMDFILEFYLEPYRSVGSTWLGALIFFLVTHVFLYIIQGIRSKGYLIYYVAGLSLFFPLVLLASIIRVTLGFSGDNFAGYAIEYCAINSDAGSLNLCGEAFAVIVFSMTVRALPVVVTMPLLFRWFYFSRSKFDGKSRD